MSDLDTSSVHAAMNDLITLFPSITDPKTEPRTTAILGCAFLEQCLRDAIASHLPALNSDLRTKIFKGTGPLSNVAARIHMARAMGILGPNTYENCKTLTQIRNKFAHRFDVHTFDHPKVAVLVDALKAPKLNSGDLVELEHSRAERFIQVITLTVGALALHLNRMAEQKT